MRHKPRLAFSAGDPNGIGPELAAGLLARPQTHAAAEVTVFGDARQLPREAVTPGKVNAAAGKWVVETLTRMAQAASAGEVDALVFAPLNKQAMKLGGANPVPLANAFDLAARMASHQEKFQ